MFLTIFIGALLFSDFLFLLTNADEALNYYTDPKAIMVQVSNRGASIIVSELYSHPNAWNFVLKNIATGNESWLKVAVEIRLAADAGAGEMLALSIGEAIEKAPQNVFRIALKGFKIENICGAPDVDDSRYNSYELSIKAIKRRQNSIAAMHDPNLKNVGRKCIQILESSKDRVKNFFGIIK